MLIDKPLLGELLNFDHPNSKGLLACYPMNEGSGDLINNAALTKEQNGLMTDGSWVPGSHGPAVAFDGTTYVDCGLNPFASGNPLSIPHSMVSLVNPHKYDVPTMRIMGIENNGFGSYLSAGITEDNDNWESANVKRSPTTFYKATDPSNFSLYTDYNVCSSHDGIVNAVYTDVDGAFYQKATKTPSLFAFDAGIHLMLGSYWIIETGGVGPFARFSGEMAYISLYNKPLTYKEQLNDLTDKYAKFQENFENILSIIAGSLFAGSPWYQYAQM